MSILDYFKMQSPLQRLLEEKIYQQVIEEIEAGQRRGGLWLQAVEKSQGDERRAKLEYIRLRVQSIKDELHVAREVHEEIKSKEAARHTQNEERRKAAEEYDRLSGTVKLTRAILKADKSQVLSLLAAGVNPEQIDESMRLSPLDVANHEFMYSDDPERTQCLGEIVEAILESIKSSNR